MNKYDAIVIGSGNGGLMAACTLANAGKKVLLMEQHNLPGGCATSFRRGRFEFEVALHELSGSNQPDTKGGLNRVLNDLGMSIPFCSIPDVFRLIAPGRDGKPIDVTMPTGSEAFLDAMEEADPGCRDKVKRFFELSNECTTAVNLIAMGKLRTQEELEAAVERWAELEERRQSLTSKV